MWPKRTAADAGIAFPFHIVDSWPRAAECGRRYAHGNNLGYSLQQKGDFVDISLGRSRVCDDVHSTKFMELLLAICQL